MTIWPFSDFIGSGLGACSALVFSPIRLGKPFLYAVQGPLGVFTEGMSPPEVLHFFLKQLGLLHTVFTLWVRVFIMLYLAEKWWWLSHCKYWYVWVSFLYTVIDSLPSASGLRVVSMKGMALSSLLFSTVNLIARSTLFMCWRKLCLFLPFGQTKCHPHTWAIFWEGR